MTSRLASKPSNRKAYGRNKLRPKISERLHARTKQIPISEQERPVEEGHEEEKFFDPARKCIVAVLCTMLRANVKTAAAGANFQVPALPAVPTEVCSK